VRRWVEVIDLMKGWAVDIRSIVNFGWVVGNPPTFSRGTSFAHLSALEVTAFSDRATENTAGLSSHPAQSVRATHRQKGT